MFQQINRKYLFMNLAYLGPKGTFSELAAQKYIAKYDKNLAPVAYNSIFEVIEAVDDGKAKEGVVPIENSVEGSISMTLDMLADKDIKVRIIQEIDLEIVHNLIVRPGAKKTDILNIYSHPQSLAQCQKYIRENFPQAKIFSTDSNARAVVIVKEAADDTNAAIGPKAAAKEWGMEIIEENIQDYENTKTRFVVISKNPIRKTSKNKTSIVFSTRKDKPGALYEILGIFAQKNINLTKIESRPRKNMIGDYLFFIDLAGSDEDPEIEKALKQVGSICSYFKKLGSYTNK